MSRYHEVYARWQRDPEGFWAQAAEAIDWYTPWDRVFDPDQGRYGRWFAGAVCNTAYNCLDRHVEGGRGDQAALIWDSPVTGTQRTLTYAELTDEVATLAAVLQEQGVEPGDRVLLYMPMVPEAAIGMLACARIGAVHSVVFGGFAPNELATRIDDADPKVILAGSCGIERSRTIAYKPLLDEAIELARHQPQTCLILQRPQAVAALVAGRDLDWQAMVDDARSRGARADCVPVAATDPLYILYTSGTTGQPKGVVRDNGGHMVSLAWSMDAIYDIRPGEVFWAASDVGWVVGHSYIVYGPLLHGATTLMFEGKPVGTPDAGAFWRVIQEHRVVSLFTAPTAFRAIKREDPDGALLHQYDLSHFRALFLAGERADPDTVEWAQHHLGVPVIDHWWQTETGWAICANPLGLGDLPVKVGSPSVAMPGYDLQVLDETGAPVPDGVSGTLGIRLPLPPGCLPTLWNAPERFEDAYLTELPGFYTTSDAGYRDPDGYFFVMERTDDVINVAGHRLSTGRLEEVVAHHDDVAECAVIGVHDDLKGQVPCGFVVLNAGVEREETEIASELVGQVRKHVGAIATPKPVMIVKRLPKTRSGKILRGTMRAIADGTDWRMPATIEDPRVLDELDEVIVAHGLGSARGS